MNRTIPYRHTRDVQRVAEYEDAKRDYTDPETDCRVSANVGELVEVELAAAGSFAFCVGGCTPCETDYLAARGATFPSVPIEELERFNRDTMRDFMDEAAEHERYRKIALFFRRAQ
jgi:hypothetical protein